MHRDHGDSLTAGSCTGSGAARAPRAGRMRRRREGVQPSRQRRERCRAAGSSSRQHAAVGHTATASAAPRLPCPGTARPRRAGSVKRLRCRGEPGAVVGEAQLLMERPAKEGARVGAVRTLRPRDQEEPRQRPPPKPCGGGRTCASPTSASPTSKPSFLRCAHELHREKARR